MNRYKKRLFEQICNDINHENDASKRPHLDAIYFKCPECRARPLTPCHTGVSCHYCHLTITLDCPDLTRNAIDRMLKMVQAQHQNCGNRNQSNNNSSHHNTPSKVVPCILPDDNVYLSWTCPECHQLEILL